MFTKSPKLKAKNPIRAADRFLTEATRLVTNIVRGEAKALDHLAQEFMQAHTEQIDDTDLPVDPWNDPAVVYGAFLALAEIAELAGRTVVPHSVLKKVLNSREAHRILLRLSEEPGGVVEQSKIPLLTYIHRCNANKTIQKLKNIGLLARHKAGPKSKKWTLELTNAGWAVVDLLHAWGLELPKEKPPLVNLLRAQPSIPDLAHDISERAIAHGAFTCGQELGTVIDNEGHTSRLRLCRAISHNIKELGPKETIEFFSGIVQGNDPKIQPRFLYRKLETISRTRRPRTRKQTRPKTLRSEFRDLSKFKECEVFISALQERITKEAESFKVVYSRFL